MSFENENMKGLVLFSHINRLGSLSAAAELLNISRSSVSKQLSALEKKIGSRLFNRTTRKIMLTEVGKQVLQEARKVELALQKIEFISDDHQSEISGVIKVSSTIAVGRIHLAPLISKFLARHPKISIDLQLDDRTVDMIAENVDISIRIGHLTDSSLIARKLYDLNGTLCASPEYLKNAPLLKIPSDLINHRCLFYRNSKITLNKWTFNSKKGDETISVSGPLSTNDPSALLSAALDHTGVLLLENVLLGDNLREGKLIPLLPEYQPYENLPMYVVYPEREFMPTKIRTLVDFIIKELPPKIRGE